MVQPMILPGKQGNAWKIFRQFIPKELADAASAELRTQLSNKSKILQRTRQFGHSRLEVYLVSPADLMGSCRFLAEVHGLTKEVTKSNLPKCFVNVYFRVAQTGWHQDSYEGAECTLAVGLYGYGTLFIKDPISLREVEFSLAPGDAFWLRHFREENLRPEHNLRAESPWFRWWGPVRFALVDG